MNKVEILKASLLMLIAILCVERAIPCSMYKITVDGKTMVGNNEDSWGRDAKIWFEQRAHNKFAAVYVGYARKQLPDGAMNEYGLAFDAFTMPRKDNVPEKDPNKKDFAYAHVKTIMQQYKTVDEVYAFLEKLNLHILNGSPIFNGGMFLFIDKTGKYLVVEANKLTLGTDDKFVLANFSIADTKNLSTIKMERYRKGVAFLGNKPLDTSLAFCAALSDTMSVSRAKIGDGTLYTNIYDLDEGLIHTYFFHDFSKGITFNLKEELAKGDHSYNFQELFAGNKNYQRFFDYQTPQNNTPILLFIAACGLLFFFSSVFFLTSFFRSSNIHYKYLKLGVSALSMALCIYAFVLIRIQQIFYFPSPYYDGHSLIVSLTSYLPFVLLLVIIPLWVVVVKIIRQKKWAGFAKWLLAINNVVYLLLIGLFAYWHLFDVFN